LTIFAFAIHILRAALSAPNSMPHTKDQPITNSPVPVFLFRLFLLIILITDSSVPFLPDDALVTDSHLCMLSLVHHDNDDYGNAHIRIHETNEQSHTQANEEKLDMNELQESNKRILFNLLPAHVATHFLDNQFRSNMVITSCASSFDLFSFLWHSLFVCLLVHALFTLVIHD
jgi:hypothetical protein